MKLFTTKGELATAGRNLATTGRTLAIFKVKISTEHQQTAVGRGHATAEHMKATAEYQKATSEHKKATAEYMNATAEHKKATAKNMNTTADHMTAAAEHMSATAEHKNATVDYKNATAKHKNATAEHMNATAEHKTVTALHDLATDCVRLLMYFFHPIQQCAQQVYHTAVPLSPTSSQLHKSCLQSIMDNQLSYVTAFSGAPSTWGSLLRTIDVRPRQLTCIAASVHGIISASRNIVDVYGVVTGVLQQSLCAPEPVTKIQHSPDGSILFLVHSSSVTMWDMQTGGYIRTFSTESKISDIAVSATSIACGSSDSSIMFWGIFTRERGKHFWSSGPVVTIDWLSSQELVVVTQRTLSVHNVVTGGSSDNLSIPGHAWGMVYLDSEGKFLVGTSQLSSGVGQEVSFFVGAKYMQHKAGPKESGLSEFGGKFLHIQTSSANRGKLSNPMVIQNKIACITPVHGVQLFDTSSNNWMNSPPLLGVAVSVAFSSNRNVVVQNKDSIQIFSIDVLASGEAHDDVHLSHIYPLGESHIICVLQPTRNLALLELETLRELCPDDDTPPLRSLLADRLASACGSLGRGLAAEFGITEVVEMWCSGTPLPKWMNTAQEYPPLHGWSPECTRVVKVYALPQWEVHVEDPKEGTTLVSLILEGGDLGTGEVYDVIFNSETRFHLNIDGPGWHVQIPYDITALPSGGYSHTISKGEPVPLLEPRSIPPYTLDVNCEWVLDAKSRKVCWISPGNIRRGNGGHFWAGLSLIMVGGDGVVRKVTFKDPDR